MHKFSMLILLILIAFTAGCGDDGKSLKTTGTVEAEEIRIVAEVGGTIKELFVDEGSVVAGGDKVALLSSPELELKVEQAKAELRATRAKLAEAESGSRVQEIAAARQEVERIAAELKSARSDLNLQQDTLEKYRQLAEQGALTEHKLNTQANLTDKAKYRLNAVESSLEAARSKLDLLKTGVKPETIEQLRAHVDAANAAVKLHEQNLSETVLRTPMKGTVLTCNYKKGEVVKPGSEIATLGNTDDLYLYTYIPENRLDKVKAGQEVQIAVDSYPKKRFKGKVTYISPEAEFTPKNVQTEEDRVRLVFKVKLKVVSGQSYLLPGMPADVYL